jgi:hypothetical protein
MVKGIFLSAISASMRCRKFNLGRERSMVGGMLRWAAKKQIAQLPERLAGGADFESLVAGEVSLEQ